MAFEQLLPFKQRWGHACVTPAEADKIYLVGGENETERRAFADIWCSWDGASTWRLMHDPAAKQKAGASKQEHDLEQQMPGRRGHACAVDSRTNMLFVVGGVEPHEIVELPPGAANRGSLRGVWKQNDFYDSGLLKDGRHITGTVISAVPSGDAIPGSDAAHHGLTLRIRRCDHRTHKQRQTLRAGRPQTAFASADTLDDTRTVLGDVWRIPLGDCRAWEQCTPDPSGGGLERQVHGWEAREQHTLVSCRVPKKGADGRYRMTQGMMLIGGLNAKGDAALSDVWVTYKSSGAEGSNYLGEHWEMVCPDAPFGKRYGHTSVVTFVDGVEKVYVIAGCKKGAERSEEDGRQNDVWCSEDGGCTWFVECEDAGFGHRSNHASTVGMNGSIYVIGGIMDERDARGHTHLKHMQDIWVSSGKEPGRVWDQVLHGDMCKFGACFDHAAVAVRVDGTRPRGSAEADSSSDSASNIGALCVIGGRVHKDRPGMQAASQTVSGTAWRSHDGGKSWSHPSPYRSHTALMLCSDGTYFFNVQHDSFTMADNQELWKPDKHMPQLQNYKQQPKPQLSCAFYAGGQGVIAATRTNLYRIDTSDGGYGRDRVRELGSHGLGNDADALAGCYIGRERALVVRSDGVILRLNTSPRSVGTQRALPSTDKYDWSKTRAAVYVGRKKVLMFCDHGLYLVWILKQHTSTGPWRFGYSHCRDWGTLPAIGVQRLEPKATMEDPRPKRTWEDCKCAVYTRDNIAFAFCRNGTYKINVLDVVVERVDQKLGVRDPNRLHSWPDATSAVYIGAPLGFSGASKKTADALIFRKKGTSKFFSSEHRKQDADITCLPENSSVIGSALIDGRSFHLTVPKESRFIPREKEFGTRFGHASVMVHPEDVHRAGASDGTMYVIGGIGGVGLQDKPNSEVWSSSNGGKSWQRHVHPDHIDLQTWDGYKGTGQVSQRFSPRLLHAAVAIGHDGAGNHELLVIGGKEGLDDETITDDGVAGGSAARYGDCIGDVWSSHDMGATWKCVCSGALFSPGPRCAHAVVVGIAPEPTEKIPNPNPPIFLLGGMDNDENDLEDVWVSHDRGITWQDVYRGKRVPAPWVSGLFDAPEHRRQSHEDNGFGPRSFHSAVFVPPRDRTSRDRASRGGTILVIGGARGDSALSSVYRSDDSGKTWTRSPGASRFGQRCQHTAVVTVSGPPDSQLRRVYVIGGTRGLSADDRDLADVWYSDDLGGIWHGDGKPMSFGANRCHSSVVGATGEVYVIGGAVSDVWILDKTTGPNGTLRVDALKPVEHGDHGAVEAPEELQEVTLKIGSEEDRLCDGAGAAVQMIIEHNLWMLTSRDSGDGDWFFEFPLPPGKGTDGVNHGRAIVNTHEQTVTVHYPKTVHRDLNLNEATGEWVPEDVPEKDFQPRVIKSWLRRWARMQSGDDTLYDNINFIDR